MGARIFTEQGYPELGDSLQTIILASSVLYELVGPGLSKLGLYLSGSYKHEEETKQIRVLDTPISETTNLDLGEETHEMTPEEAYTEAAIDYSSGHDMSNIKKE